MAPQRPSGATSRWVSFELAFPLAVVLNVRSPEKHHQYHLELGPKILGPTTNLDIYCGSESTEGPGRTQTAGPTSRDADA